jgi:transcriptional regulator
MYTPAHYKAENSELILETIKRFSFSTVITQGPDGPCISHLPLLLEIKDNVRSLIGHCARANPQWKHFAEGQEVTALFHGPHSYISPAWYKPEPDNVPTWNYVSVHIKGKAQLIENTTDAYEILQTAVRYFESEYGTGWELPAQLNSELKNLLTAIVAFRIEIKDIQAKFKLSQRQTATDRANVIEQLPKIAGSDGAAIAEYMKRVTLQGIQ